MGDLIQFAALFNRCHLPPLDQPQVLYAYFEARPDRLGTRLPLNFSLVLDRSGSMSGPKIKQLRDAVRAMIGRLEPADIISMVAFNAHAEVLIPATPAQDKDGLAVRVGRLEAGGGTSMAPAMRAGLAEVVRHQSPANASRLVVLTDGQTTGEEECRNEADRAAAAGVPLIALGLGTDWNEDLLLDLAQRTGKLGDAWLIKRPEDVGPIFEQVLSQMAVVAQDVAIEVKLAQGVEARRVWQVTPQIMDVTPLAVHERTVNLDLPELAEGGTGFLLELLIAPRNPGHYRFAQAQISYNVPGRAPSRETARANLTAEITTDAARTGQLDAQVMDIVAKVAVFDLQSRALDDAARQDFERATVRLRAAHTLLLQQGELELAETALAEAERLESGQGLSSEGRKTIKLIGGKTVRLTRPALTP